MTGAWKGQQYVLHPGRTADCAYDPRQFQLGLRLEW